MLALLLLIATPASSITTEDSVTVSVSFAATGGTISPAGLYTAGPAAGTYRVVAAVANRADTVAVVLAARPSAGSARRGTTGVPFGPFAAWEGTSLKPHTGPFTLGIAADDPGNLVARITAARARKTKLLLAMTGGHHDRYKTAGMFDMAKWRTRMNAYDTPTLRAAVAKAVADGIVIGNSVMDEPNNVSRDNSWGPPGTMTKARVDTMCGDVKRIFPTLPVGVVHDYRVFDPEADYEVCDFVLSQYQESKGSVTAFRDAGLAFGSRSGVAMAFSLNILDGGTRMSGCPVPATGGRGTYGGNCRMRPDQMRAYGLALGPAGCALTLWRYDRTFMADTANQRAFRDIQTRLSGVPTRSCRRL